MKKEVKLKSLIKPLCFVFFAVLLELVNFLWLGFKVTGNASQLQPLPTYFLVDFAIIMFLAALMLFSSKLNWFSNIIYYLFLGLQLFVNMVNATLYKVFGDIFSFDMMKLGAEAVQAFKFEFLDFWSIIVNFAILAVIITTQVLLDKKLKKTVSFGKLNCQAALTLLFFGLSVFAETTYCAQTLNFASAEAGESVVQGDDYLWDNMHLKLEAYKKFGTYGFYIKSLADLISNRSYLSEEEKEALLKKLDDGKQEVDVNAPLYGDNLIVIMLESFEWFAIDPINTPTLWDIRTNSGISFEKFYGKNKTNVSEDIGILGGFPKDNGIDELSSKKYTSTPYTLPNLFRSQGYTSNYFHSWEKTFYKRSMVNSAFGFEHVYALEDTNIVPKREWSNWALEQDFLEEVINKNWFMPEGEKFFSFYTTVGTHGSYNVTIDRYADLYAEYDKNLPQLKEYFANETTYVFPEDEFMQKCLRQYKTAAMDTDRMIEKMINTLETRGILDNTTILMYADHNCYFEDMYSNIKGTDKAEYYNIYNYNIPCMIYSKKLSPQRNYDFVNTYDIFPTICKLYGLPYNTTLIQGHDMLSEDVQNSLMVSNLSGIFNADFYSLNITDITQTHTGTIENYQEKLDKFRSLADTYFLKQRDIELIYQYGLAAVS